MKPDRRRALVTMGAVLGSAFLPDAAAETELPPESTARETVAGIGGLFFRAHEPQKLAQWYQDHLGITVTPQNYHDPVWEQEAGPTVFAPFAEDTGYFGDKSRQWMINFRVRNLDRMAAQLKAAGIAVKIDPQLYPNGRFARLHDPEGNAIELWQAVRPTSKT